METSEPSRMRRMITAIMSFPKAYGLKPFLKSALEKATSRAHWLALAFLIAVGILSFWTTSTLTETIAKKKQLRTLFNAFQTPLNTVTDAETGQRGYLLTGDDSYLQPYRVAATNIVAQIQEVKNLLNAVPSQRSKYDDVQRLVESKFAELEKTIQLRQSNQVEAAMQIVRSGHGKQVMDEIRTISNQIKREIEEVQAKFDRRSVVLATRATQWSIFGNVLAAILFVLVLRTAFRERKRAEGRAGELAGRTAQLEAANQELDSFCYSISHDLRAPLRAIDGFSRIILEDYSGPLAPEGKTYLQSVRDNTRQMGQLVDDLLAFAHLGRHPLNKQSIAPGTVVRRCLEEMTKEQQGRQVEIIIGDLPSHHADPALLKQVWTNLLSNALKYTRNREIARIEIDCRTQPRLAVNGQKPSSDDAGPEIVYFVKDNGTGFDMKYAGKLFGVFQRLHRASDYEGTGVGLAIVQRIIQRHGGRIWGEAIPNEGATFSFTLE